MPRHETIIRTLYKFEELNETAKEKARDWYREASAYDEWWDYIYEDAKRIGLKITGFDLNRGDIHGTIIDPEATAHSILKEHGEACDTYKTAKGFLDSLAPLQAEIASSGANAGMMSDDEFFDKIENQVETLSTDFKYDLLQDYLSMLRKEEEHYFSTETVTENIQANEYEFLENGKKA